jgi:heme/copper-type cytochrome/quinol oxidase subunit 2
MSSIHRVGLAIAGIAAAVTVAGAFVVQGYVAAQQAQTQATAAATAAATAEAAATTLPTQIVYIKPAPTPVAQATPAPVQQPPVIHVVVPGFGDDGGRDGGSDH